MFSSIVQYITSFLTNETPVADEGGVHGDDDVTQFHGKKSEDGTESQHGTDHPLNDLQENGDVAKIDDESAGSADDNCRDFDGVVTSFFNNRGLINDEIYFSQIVVIGNDQPKVGDNVFVRASRSHAEGGWVAKTVQIVSLWTVEDSDAASNAPTVDVLIGSVFDVSGNWAKIRAREDFTVDVKKFRTGFKPFRGDMVSIEVWNKNPDGLGSSSTTIDINSSQYGANMHFVDSIISIAPLREKQIHGVVTEVFQRYGFINEDVYFTFSVCQRGTFVRKGDAVTATVIESKQPRADWRAVHVQQKRSHQSPKTSSSNQQPQRAPMACNHNNGIEVRKELKFGELLCKEKRQMAISISNSSLLPQTLHSVKSSMDVPGFQCIYGPGAEETENDNVDREKTQEWLHPNTVLYPKQQKQLRVEFIPVNIGKIEFLVVFTFDAFEVSCIVTANVMDSLQSELSRGAGTYQKPQMFLGRRVNSTSGNILPGQRPVRKKRISLPNRLARYPIPSYLQECLLHTDGDVELLVPELSQPLHISNYRKKLSTLLYAEEIQMEEEMRQFDLFKVILRKNSEYLSLTVTGLAEGRPSLLLGDSIVASYSERSSASTYEGFIHEIRAEDVLLKFCEDFHNTYQYEHIDVQFRFNRTSLRRAHQAIEHALNMGEDTLFPTSILEKTSLVDLKQHTFKPINNILNERQTKAVQRILSGCARPIPYVLFGPPGTGKSVTVVEAILQVLKNIKHSRILACAPSNSAADLIAERLHLSGVLKKNDMVRINAFQRSKVNMPECIEPYCVNDVDDLQFASRHRIIVATCNMSGFLFSFKLRTGHFTHIFVDEAGQATEPECMIPCGFAAGCEESQIVLAGDPFQLGPVLRSEIAQDYGLNISLLERLSMTKLYERNEERYLESGAYNPLVVTKLVNNYRSHEDLLQLSSSMFYHRELIPCADKKLVDMFVGMDILPNKKCPFIFHGVRGEDFREGNSPSWFNPAEAVEVVKYVQRILKRHAIHTEQIGIITPYRKQVEKIRLLLDRFDLSDIKVGSVEEFQGQERQCIVISTVRSNEELINSDCHHNIGFLSNPKRFNVSITRAQALMVIVGNPIVLCHDPYWCAMLQYAVMHETYIGCDLPSLDNELVRESFRRALHLLGVSSQSHDDTTQTKDHSNESIEEETEEHILSPQVIRNQDDSSRCDSKTKSNELDVNVNCSRPTVTPNTGNVDRDENSDILSYVTQPKTTTVTSNISTPPHARSNAFLDSLKKNVDMT